MPPPRREAVRREGTRDDERRTKARGAGRLPAAARSRARAEFAETARRLQNERDAAASVVERLLRDTPREEWPALAERADLQTCGALERLGNFVAEVLGRDPRHALAVAELAVSIAEAIPREGVSARRFSRNCAHTRGRISGRRCCTSAATMRHSLRSIAPRRPSTDPAPSRTIAQSSVSRAQPRCRR